MSAPYLTGTEDAGPPPCVASVRRRRSVAVCAALAALVVAAISPSPAAAASNIFTVAGTGTGGFSGDGGQATAARVNGPRGVAWTADGGFLFADFMNSRIRRVASNGIISTVAGTGVDGYNGDGIQATQARLNYVHGVAALPDGTVLIDDLGNQRIRRVASNGVIRTVAGNGIKGYGGDGGPATAARIASPRGIAATADGGFLIADSDNNRIRRVSPTGTITTVAGSGTRGFGGDGGPATAARLSLPFGVSPTGDGGFLIADTDNNRVRRVAPNGTITTVAGNGSSTYSGDGGPALQAGLRPGAVAATPEGGFVIADNPGNRVRYVSPTGTISTVAGSGVAGSSGDGGPSDQAEVNGPRGVAVRPDGDFLIAEFGPADFSQPGGDRVRLVDFAPPLVPVEDQTPPARPTSLSATAGNAKVKLDWADNGEGDLAGYDVYRGTTAGGPYEQVNSTRLSASSYTDSGLDNGTRYYYVVTAADTNGNVSAPSGEASAAPTPTPYRAAVLATPGLVSYWPLGESSGATTATDAKGTNDGTYRGGVTLGEPGAVVDSDTAARFDGVDDEMIASGPGLALTSAGTLEGWFYWQDGTSLVRDTTSTYTGWILAYAADANIGYRVGGRTFYTSRSTASVKNGWHQFTATLGGGRSALYIDGNLVHSASAAGSVAAALPWHVMRNGGIARFTGGLADEVAIYDRALSAATVKQHYEAGTP